MHGHPKAMWPPLSGLIATPDHTSRSVTGPAPQLSSPMAGTPMTQCAAARHGMPFFDDLGSWLPDAAAVVTRHHGSMTAQLASSHALLLPRAMGCINGCACCKGGCAACNLVLGARVKPFEPCLWCSQPAQIPEQGCWPPRNSSSRAAGAWTVCASAAKQCGQAIAGASRLACHPDAGYVQWLNNLLMPEHRAAGWGPQAIQARGAYIMINYYGFNTFPSSAWCLQRHQQAAGAGASNRQPSAGHNWGLAGGGGGLAGCPPAGSRAEPELAPHAHAGEAARLPSTCGSPEPGF
jgi:hypothetical protein